MNGIAQVIALVIGVFGCMTLAVVPEIGIFIVILSALIFVGAGRSRRHKIEERRHRELLEAVKAGKVKNDDFYED